MIETIKSGLKKSINRLFLKEKSPYKLALACSLGIYIAFSPFPGLHTAMVFLGAWLMRVNAVVVLASSCFINNPWTMVPVYGAGYVFGDWLCSTVYGYNMHVLNPSWMNSFNTMLVKYTGLKGMALWSFLIGGNIVALTLAIGFFPLMHYMFKTLAHENAQKQ